MDNKERAKVVSPERKKAAEELIRRAIRERQAALAAFQKRIREEKNERKQEAPAAAGVGKPQISIEQQENQWKRLGIYLRRGAVPQIPGGDFLVYLWNPTDTGTYLYKGAPVSARASSDDVVVFDGNEYVRLPSFYPLSYEEELLGAKNVAKQAGSTTRASVLIGKNLVFKTASMDGIVGCLQEVSRSLRVISAGFPHAAVFGMYERGSRFYIVEEKLDIATSNVFFNELKQTAEKIFNGRTITRDEQIRLGNYLLMFAELTRKLLKFDIGGDFKLNNLSFRRGNQTELFATDLLMGMPGNQFIPMTYAHWVEKAAKPEGGEALFIDPFFRLNYYEPQSGGSKRRALKTRRIRSRKTKTRRSKI
jgi:hypothetical protein